MEVLGEVYKSTIPNLYLIKCGYNSSDVMEKDLAERTPTSRRYALVPMECEPSGPLPRVTPITTNDITSR